MRSQLCLYHAHTLKLFHYSTGGSNMQRNAAMHQQRQERRRLQASKQWVQTMQVIVIQKCLLRNVNVKQNPEYSEIPKLFWENLSSLHASGIHLGKCEFWSLKLVQSTSASPKFSLKYGSLVNWCLDSSFTVSIPGFFLISLTEVAHISTSRQASLKECLHLL